MIGYPYLKCCHGAQCPHADSVFNICLEVEDVSRVCQDMETHGSRVITPVHTLTTDHGELTCAVVSSPCDNVIHSLVNTSQYTGPFLPGFDQEKNSDNDIVDTGLTHLDHVTYVCRPGDSDRILTWYQQTCGMTRFKMTPSEGEEGVEVTGEAGLRLKVGEWMSEWMCREVGVSSDDQVKERNFKLVLAEPLEVNHDGHVNR